MNRQEFIARMKEALTGMEPEMAADILADYEEHFEEGKELGKSEEEICEELGPIEELEADFLEESRNAVAVCQSPSGKDTDRNETGAIEVGEAERPGRYCLDASFTGITADLQDADFTVEISPDEKIHIEYRDSDQKRAAQSFFCVKANETLQLRVEKRHAISKEERSVLLQIPATVAGITAKGVSGDMDLQGIAVANGSFSTVSGDIELNDVKSASCRCESVSGDILLENSSLKQVVLKSVSGGLQIKGVIADRMEARSASGDIELQDSSENSMELESVSGDVEAAACPGCQAHLKSVSGDSTLIIEESVQAVVSTRSGDIQIVCRNGGKGYQAELSAISGNLRAEFGSACQKSRRRLLCSFGEENCRITANSISGEIRIASK